MKQLHTIDEQRTLPPHLFEHFINSLSNTGIIFIGMCVSNGEYRFGEIEKMWKKLFKNVSMYKK